MSLLSGSAVAQTGGFLESATSTEYREPLSAGQLQEILPARGRFTFPTPYSTLASRLTNATDCGGGDCVNYVGYSYWSNINNHVGSDTMLILLGLDRSRGGPGPSLFSYNKTTGETHNVGPLFDTTSSLSWATGEGWYFSATRASSLYLNDGPRMLRHDVLTRVSDVVYDVRPLVGRNDVYIWQMHSSADDRVHSATVKHSSTFQPLGCVTYREDTAHSTFFPAIGDFDECQVDKSGRWLVIKENVDNRNGEDNRIIDLHTGLEQVFYDEDGAAGHSDLGFGYMVAEDNYAAQPGAVRVWKLNESVFAPGQGTLVYSLTSWSSGVGHLAHGNARPDLALAEQTVCSSNATRLALPRVNEIVCYRLDGSLQVLVVAPNMTNLDAAGGGTDDYAKLPKGNQDVTGDFFIWTSNTGGNRLDAFVVHVPQSKLTGTSSGTETGSPVTWLSVVNLSTANSSLQKISGCDGCPDATAVSNQTIGSGAWVQWSTPENQTLRVLGLSPNSVVTGVADIPYAIRLQSGTAEIRELGVYKAEIPFAINDTFRISVDNGTVHYQKNGTAFYASGVSATQAMRVHAVFYGMNGVVSNVAGGSASGGTADTTAPTVTVVSPSNGAVVSGSVTVSATTTDDVGVTYAEFYLDDVLQATDDASPYSWTWNTASVPDGTHTVQVKARDGAGNTGASAVVSVTVRNTSAIALTGSGYKVKGLQKVDLKWSGATSATVTVYRNGVLVATPPNTGAYTDNINKNGNGTYKYRVCDAETGVCSNEVTVTF